MKRLCAQAISKLDDKNHLRGRINLLSKIVFCPAHTKRLLICLGYKKYPKFCGISEFETISHLGRSIGNCIGNLLQKIIVGEINAAGMYSIAMDCTTDSPHADQLSYVFILLRCMAVVVIFMIVKIYRYY